jgi:hypothetical protein
VGLELGPLSLMSIIEELLGRNSSGSSLENWEYVRGDPLRWPYDTLYPQKLALASPTSGGRSVGRVRLRTKATELSLQNCRLSEKTTHLPFYAVEKYKLETAWKTVKFSTHTQKKKFYKWKYPGIILSWNAKYHLLYILWNYKRTCL